jgi:two-component system chemotaxis sensor kinase CheA
MGSKDQDLMRELLQAFHAEAPDHIQTLNKTLLQLERQPEGEQRTALLQGAFRAAHSLKGAARAVGVLPVEKLAHHVEEALKLARENRLPLDPSTCDILYYAFDVIQKLLDGEPSDIEPLMAQLSTLSQGVSSEAQPPTIEEVPVHPIAVEGEETIRVAVSKLDLLMAQTGELLTARISAEQRLADMQAVRQEFNQFARLWRDVKTLGARTSQNSDAVSYRGDTLQFFEEHLHQLSRSVNHLDTEINRDALRLGMISGRLQTEMRRVRMVPFQTLEPLFQRTVRDAAHVEGKQVELTIEGGEVELDKKVLEALKDSFLHLLRNAVGHGIEMPEVRAVLNKPPIGEIRIAVVQRGSEAHISVYDDGQGFNLDQLRKSAETHQVAVGTDASAGELINLAFLPGMTTSPQLTALSGRGVGLDVVRRQIESLQGRIQVESVAGQNTSFHFVVPVSLAMTRVLLIGLGGHRYAVPLASVERIVRPRDTFSVEGQVMLAFDQGSLPLVSLASILNLPFQSGSGLLAVIVGVGDQRIALLVDEVLTEQELAVKPFGKPILRARHLAGVAILGSGEPVVVLNTADLVKSARGVSVQPVLNVEGVKTSGQNDSRRILVVDDSITTRTLEKNILEAAGYEVFTATDGTRALQQLKAHPIALVVADIEMPNMDGIALTRSLRESKEFQELPIILVTSLESAEDRERGMMAGANAYIVKRGFNQADLLATIQQLL